MAAGAQTLGRARSAVRYGGSTVELSAETGDDGVWLWVRDDGEGFPAGFETAAFERFTRADAARGRGGAGLGLAIVAVIARAHGGSAGAGNRAAGGAEVWIRLPAARASGHPPRVGASSGAR